MKIIIAGCGKVGYALAEQLSEEGHEIAIIEPRKERVQNAVDSLDVMGYVGNGNSYRMQSGAGVEEADLLIAASGNDEVNLLSCLIAKKAGNCKTIARVRNPEYMDDISFIREELGLSLSINPEYATARDISRLIQIPSALDLDTFSNGRAYMIRLQIPENSPWDGMKIIEIARKNGNHFLICVRERDGEVVIPGGDDDIRSGDRISMMAPSQRLQDLFKTIGIKTKPIHNVMIAGGGTIAYYTAQALLKSRINTTIIEKDYKRCQELSEELEKATIIHGDAADAKLLMEEGLSHMDAFVSLTNMDEENIMLSLYAADKVPGIKMITKVNNIAFEGIINKIGIGSIISPKALTAEHIIQFVRDLSSGRNTLGESKIDMVYRLADNRAQAVEFTVDESAKVVGHMLRELKLKKNLLVCSIFRDSQVIIPSGGDKIEAGDKVVVVTTDLKFSVLDDIVDGVVR